MSMDALALLNALDVIRNQEEYQSRLQSLVDAQDKLNTSQYIVETVEVAQARLEEANRLLEKHRQLMADAEVDIEKERIVKLQDLTDKEVLLEKKQQELNALAQKLREQSQNLEQEQRKLESVRAAQATRNEAVQQHLQESTDIRNKYLRKLDELKSIVNN